MRYLTRALPTIAAVAKQSARAASVTRAGQCMGFIDEPGRCGSRSAS